MIAPTVVALSIAVGNVMSNPTMSPAEVRHDVRALFGLDASVVCATEIAPRSYKATYRRVARAARYRTAALYGPNPIAVRRPWRVEAVHLRRLTDGLEGITPNRYATVARLADGGRRVVVICSHLVSRAWTHLEATTGLRRELWRTEADRIRRIVRRWHARGIPVLVLGDMNHPRRIRWAARQRTIANTGLLQATAVPPAGSRVVRLAGREIPDRQVFTDHPMVRRRVAFVP